MNKTTRENNFILFIYFFLKKGSEYVWASKEGLAGPDGPPLIEGCYSGKVEVFSLSVLKVCWSVSVCVFPLTVGAAVQLHSEAHPAAGVPVQRYEAQEACPDWVGQPVLDHSLRVHVPDEFLRGGGTEVVCVTEV